MICKRCKNEIGCDLIWKYGTEAHNCYNNEIKKDTKILVMLFGAEHCIYCPTAERITKQAIASIGNDNISYVKKDREKDRDLAIKYSIGSVPAYVILVNGDVKSSFAGLKTEKQIKDLILKEL